MLMVVLTIFTVLAYLSSALYTVSVLFQYLTTYVVWTLSPASELQ